MRFVLVFTVLTLFGEGEVLSDSQKAKLTERAFKVLAHETGHMFGIHHCTAFHCEWLLQPG